MTIIYGKPAERHRVVAVRELAEQLANKVPLESNVLKPIIDSLIDVIVENLEDGSRIRLTGLGTLYVRLPMREYQEYMDGRKYRCRVAIRLKGSPKLREHLDRRLHTDLLEEKAAGLENRVEDSDADSEADDPLNELDLHLTR